MPTGFVFGKADGKFAAKKEDKDGHILIVGGAGSGKTSCLAIPSLLSWGERVFCIDVKGELYQHTHQKRYNAKVFDPLNTSTYGYDPFYTLSKTNNQAQEAQAISMSLIPLPPDIKDPFWIQSAQDMLTGVILHFYNLGATFIETMQELQSSPIKELIKDIYELTTTQNARFFLNVFVNMDDKVLTGIYAELSRNIKIFATDKNIIECLSRRQKITPDDLEQGKDIYICIPEYLLRQWKNLLTLIVSQFLRHFERRPERTATPILFLLDEFPHLGKIEGITDGLATLRGKKITICLIIQSLAQLDMIYGREARQVIADNCQYKAVLNATDADTQEYFSKLVGTHEKIKTSTNRHFKPITHFPAGLGTFITTEEKRRIKPEKFATMNSIALFTPFGFFQVEKSPYYENFY